MNTENELMNEVAKQLAAETASAATKTTSWPVEVAEKTANESVYAEVIEDADTMACDPKVILQQLGGVTFRRMTGTYGLVAMKDGLKMSLVGNNSRAKYLYIQLKTDDTYRMTFGKIRNGEWIPVVVRDGVYCDQLAEVFTEVTGLYTTMRGTKSIS